MKAFTCIQLSRLLKHKETHYMGQAKKRGTFEHRKHIAIERDNKILKMRTLMRQDIDPKKQQRENQINTFLAFAQGVGASALYK